MREAKEFREGDFLNLAGQLHKVRSVAHHAGTGQFGGSVRATIQNLQTGHLTELRWAPDQRLDDAHLDRVEMQFLYVDQDVAVFMHPETYEQLEVPRSALEKLLPFLTEGSMVHVQLYQDRPVDVEISKNVPVTVATCGAGVRGRDQTALKEATLENGLTILVPQFIQPGDTVLVNVESREYVERVRRR